ncbi:MAG: hypothetical protein PVI54_13665 [Desulfobacteraceae bacterium]
MDREDIWHSMSNLYLDDEIDNIDLLLVAEELAKTDLTSQEMDEIFYEEVHPVLCWNFTVPAGVWSSFDKEHLTKLIYEYKRKQNSMSLLNRWQEEYPQKQIDRLKGLVKIDWEKTKFLIEFIRDKRIIKK